MSLPGREKPPPNKFDHPTPMNIGYNLVIEKL